MITNDKSNSLFNAASNEKQRNYVQTPSTHQLNRSHHQQQQQQEHEQQQPQQQEQQSHHAQLQHQPHHHHQQAIQPSPNYTVEKPDFSAHEKASDCQNAQYNRIILHRNIGLADENDEPMKEGVADQLMVHNNNNNNSGNSNQQAESESSTEQQAHQRDNSATFLNSQNHNNNNDLGIVYQQTPQEKQPLQIRLAETFTNFAINDANRMQSNHLHGNENNPTQSDSMNMTCNLDANDV